MSKSTPAGVGMRGSDPRQEQISPPSAQYPGTALLLAPCWAQASCPLSLCFLQISKPQEQKEREEQREEEVRTIL